MILVSWRLILKISWTQTLAAGLETAYVFSRAEQISEMKLGRGKGKIQDWFFWANDPLWIIIKIPNPSQEPPVSSKAPKQDLKDMDFFATSTSRWIVKIPNNSVSKLSDHIKIKIPNPSQKPPSDIPGLYNFKIKIESWNLKHGCIKVHWPDLIEDQDPNP